MRRLWAEIEKRELINKRVIKGSSLAKRKVDLKRIDVALRLVQTGSRRDYFLFSNFYFPEKWETTWKMDSGKLKMEERKMASPYGSAIFLCAPSGIIVEPISSPLTIWIRALDLEHIWCVTDIERNPVLGGIKIGYNFYCWISIMIGPVPAVMVLSTVSLLRSITEITAPVAYA